MGNQEKVDEFHIKYGFGIREPFTPDFKDIEAKVRLFRLRLARDEVREYIDAEASNIMADVAKEMADVMYILYGTAGAYGFDLDVVFDLVHQSNMTKDGIIREDGKLTKGPGYRDPGPDIRRYFDDLQALRRSR